jgi:hypothetical protein
MVTLLPLVILHLEPHHMTPESTERSALNQHFLVRICHQYNIRRMSKGRFSR